MSEYLKIQLDIHNAPFPKQIHPVPSCFHDIICTVCEAYKLDCFPMFASSFSFVLNNNKETYYRQVDTRDDLIELLYRCCGLSYKVKEKVETGKLYNTIIYELKENRPVAIHFDSFYCPWDTLNGKTHNDHMVLVTGIDEKEGKLFVCDPWFYKEEWIPIGILEEACTYYAVFKFDNYDRPKIDDEYLISNLNCSINRDGQNAFENIRKFAQRLPIDFDFSDLDTENFFNSTCSKTIERVVYSRCKYLAFLYYMVPKSKILTKEKCVDFERFLNAWKIVQILFAKAYIQKLTPGAPFLHHLSSKIISIADEEERFLTHTIFSQVNAKHLGGTTEWNLPKNKEVINIDLADCLNNKAFDYLCEKYNAAFTEKGTFLLLDDEALKNKYIVKDIKIPILENAEKEYDNAICLGQEISCSAKNVSRLIVCACAEFGCYWDRWTLVDDKGREHCFNIFVSDHSFSPHDDEIVVYTTDKYTRESDGISVMTQGNCHIFAEYVYLGENLNIEKIILPNCPFVHVFSVALV